MISKHNIENKKIKIKNNSSIVLEKLKPGNEKTIEVDRNGIPLENFWRRRLKDSKIDGCIEIIKDENSTTKKETKKITGVLKIKKEEILTNGN